MQNTAQINHYMISHGVKDQLLVMFDQIVSSDRLDENDSWYVKSVYDLTYLIRGIAVEAVKEDARKRSLKLLPIEEKHEVDKEVLKLYWHFFSAQKTTFGDLKERYSGFERLKTVAHLIEQTNYCIKNPGNISLLLKQAGIGTWGESFINLGKHEQKVKEIKKELKQVDDLKAQFDEAIAKTKLFRSKQKNILDKLDVIEKQLAKDDHNDVDNVSEHVRAVAKSLNLPEEKLVKLSKLIDFSEEVLSESAQEAYAERLKVYYKGIINNGESLKDLKHLVLTAHRVDYDVASPEALSQSIVLNKIFDDLSKKIEQLDTVLKEKYKASKSLFDKDINSFDIDKADIIIKKLLETNQSDLTRFEIKVLDAIQTTLEMPLNKFDQETYDALEPCIIKTINEQNIAYLADGMSKITNTISVEDVHPSLQNIVKFSQGANIVLSDFEYQIYAFVEGKLGHGIADMSVEDFAQLEPVLLNAVGSQKLTGIEEALLSDEEDDGYVYDGYSQERSVEVDRVHPELQILLDISSKRAQQSSVSGMPAFQLKLVEKLETGFNGRLVEMNKAHFQALSPVLLRAIRSNDLDEIDSYLVAKYPKSTVLLKKADFSPELMQEILWPEKQVLNEKQAKNLSEIVAFFKLGTHFKRGAATSYDEFKYLFARPEMKQFYLALAVKMCSYTTALLNRRPLEGQEINLAEVNSEFKAKTMDLVFKFASFAKVLACEKLSSEEIETLQIAVEKTVNLMYRNFPDKYGPIAKWTLKRYKQVVGENPDKLDLEMLVLFSDAYAMNFEDPKEHFLVLLDGDKEGDQKLTQFKNKLSSVGGFPGLSKADRSDFVKIYNSTNVREQLSVLHNWVANKVVNKVINKHSSTPGSQGSYDKTHFLNRMQDLDESSKQLLARYFSEQANKANGTSNLQQLSADFLTFIAVNEVVFRKPVYEFSNKQLSDLNSFVQEKSIDCEKWRAWLEKGAQKIDRSDTYLDIVVLYDIFSFEKSSQDALKNSLRLYSKSQQGHLRSHYLQNLMLIEKKFKSEGLSYDNALKMINRTVADYSDFPSPRFEPVFKYEINDSNGAEVQVLATEVKALMGNLNQLQILPDHMKVISLLDKSDYATLVQDDVLINFNMLMAQQKRFNLNAATTLIEAEKLLESIGYVSDFSDETTEELPAYQVFFKSFMPVLKQTNMSEHIKTSEAKTFSPKVIKDALLAQKKSLLEQLALEQKTIHELKEKNELAMGFVHNMQLINTAYNASEEKKDIDEIKSLDSIAVSGYNPDNVFPLMTKFMPSIKKVEVMDEQNLADVIKVLRLIQDIKTFGANEVKAFYSSFSEDQQDRILNELKQLQNDYARYTNVELSQSDHLGGQDVEQFVGAIRLLQDRSFSTEAEFSALLRHGAVMLPLNVVLSEMDVDQIVELIGYVGNDSKEKGVILDALHTSKMDLVINALGMSGDMIDLDIQEETNHGKLVEKTLFLLSQKHTNVYEGILSKHVDANGAYRILHALGKKYVDYLLKNAVNEKERQMINSVAHFPLSGYTEMFVSYMMYLMPKNSDKDFLDQLIAQFAPAWSHKLKYKHGKATLDTALSALLLSHHGASKLFENNINYHLPSQLADLGMITALALCIVSFCFWTAPLTYVFGASLLASMFVKVCVEHSKNMALDPYAISDQRGLVESIKEVDAIRAQYDNSEAQLLMRILEDLPYFKDSTSFEKYGNGLESRLMHVDLLRLCEYEEANKIVPKETDSIVSRYRTVFNQLQTMVDRKIFIKELDQASSIVLSDSQYEKLIKIKEFVTVNLDSELPYKGDDEAIKNILYALYEYENIEVSKSQMNLLYDFVSMHEQGKALLDLKDPMRELGDLEAAKLFSAIDKIKKIKSQIEDYSAGNEYFPDYEKLMHIDGIHENDVKFMKEHAIKSFKALKDLVDPTDYTANGGLFGEEYNKSVVNIIEDHMKASGEDLRMICKIKPMTMFGSLKIDDTSDLEDIMDGQSSFSLVSPVRV